MRGASSFCTRLLFLFSLLNLHFWTLSQSHKWSVKQIMIWNVWYHRAWGSVCSISITKHERKRNSSCCCSQKSCCDMLVGDVVCTNHGVRNNNGPSTGDSSASIDSHIRHKYLQAIAWNRSPWTTGTSGALAMHSKNPYYPAFQHTLAQFLVEHLLVCRDVFG